MPPNNRVRDQLPPYDPGAGSTDPSGPRPPGYDVPDGPRPPQQPSQPPNDWDEIGKGLEWLMGQHQDWKKVLAQLIAQGNQGAKELQNILNLIEKGDIAGAMNAAKRSYKIIMEAKASIEALLKNPVGGAVDVGMDILGVLIQMDPVKRGEMAKQLLMKWFPWFDWNAPPAVWRRIGTDEFVNQDSSNTDYAGRPLPGYENPWARKAPTWYGPGGR